MKSKILLLVCVAFSISLKTIAQINAGDSLALIDLYKSTHGSGWIHKQNWLRGPVNTWYGVIVSGNRVVELNLGDNNLTGRLPESIGNLTALSKLTLFYNSITGPIPGSMGNLILIQSLFLSNNQLSGSIPSSLGNLKSVLYFTLNSNQLTGHIPTSLTSLPQVYTFNLSYNQLSGPIPDSIGFLKCWYLLLNNNKLTGTIPPSIKILEAVLLDLSVNNLSGQIPDFTVLQRNFSTEVNLNNNHLTTNLNPKHPTEGPTNISNNDFTFTGLEKLLNNGGYVYYYPVYSNQAPLKLRVNGKTLSVSAGGTLSNNTYNWYKDGALDTTITGDSMYTPHRSGSYYANITNAIATQLTLTTDTVSFNANILSKRVACKVSPNPATNMLLVSGLDPAENYTIRIVKISGNATLQAISKNQTTLQINVSSLQPGSYLLNIKNATTSQSFYFLKQ